jgi:copper chaperone
VQHTLNVQGMTCGHCEKAVTQAIHTLDPSAKVTIDRDHHLVDIWTELPREKLQAAITDEGYVVT